MNELKEWIIGKIKHKDIFTRKLKDIKEDKDFLLIEYIDKKSQVFIMPELDVGELSPEKDYSTEIITLNSKENFDILLKQWKKLAKIENLKIFFVNPKLEHDNFWIINPYIHNMITDKGSLKQGLTALFNSIEPVCD